MTQVNWADADKTHCSHDPPHATWTGKNDRGYAVCRMADRHLYNTMALLARQEIEPLGIDAEDIEDWQDVFDRELSRRYAAKVIEGYDLIKQLHSIPDEQVRGKQIPP